MAAFYTIDQYQYRIYFGDEPQSPNETFVPTMLHIKAVNHASLSDYRCDITSDCIDGYGLIPSLDVLYDILADGFAGKKTTVVTLTTVYDAKKDEIHVVLVLRFAYNKETLDLTLVSVKDLASQEILNNKMQYFNKRLTDLEDERKEIDGLKETVAGLSEQLQRLKFHASIGHRLMAVSQNNQMIHMSVPQVQILTVGLDQFSVANLQGSRTGGVAYANCRDYGLDASYYFDIFNQFVELRSVTISDINWSDLKYISNCSKITELILTNLANLVDVSVVITFTSLKTLTITECRKIKNLKILEQCKNLELLKAHSAINTGVFAEALSFRIEMV